MRSVRLLAAFALAAAVAACMTTAPPPPPPASELVLPPGDVERGRQAFLELECDACHEVRDGGFPKPTIYPPMPFVLGDRWETPPSEAWLVTSLVNPSHEILPGHVVLFHGTGTVYRMKDYSRTMIVEQMTDLVAFLRSLAGPKEEP
jgi:mono/diheme cytochrome c family protein